MQISYKSTIPYIVRKKTTAKQNCNFFLKDLEALELKTFHPTSHCSSHRTETNIELYTCHTISYIMKWKKREIIAALLSSLTHNLADIARATAALTGLKYEN